MNHRLGINTLFISICIVLLLKSMASDCSHAKASLRGPAEVYSYTPLKNIQGAFKKTNIMTLLPKKDESYTILKVLASVMSVIALSIYVTRCLRYLKGQGMLKSNRRLAGNGDDCPAGGAVGGAAGGAVGGAEAHTGEVSREKLQEMVEIVKGLTIVLKGKSEDDWEAVTALGQEAYNQYFAWRQGLVHRLLPVLTKAYDQHSDKQDVEKLKAKRDQLYRRKIEPNFEKVHLPLAKMAVDELKRGARTHSEIKRVDLSKLTALLDSMDGSQEVVLEQVDYFADMRQQMEARPRDFFPRHAAYVAAGSAILEELVHLYNISVRNSRIVEAAVAQLMQQDEALLWDINHGDD